MDFFQDLTPHTTVLTPNRRLAAVIAKTYAQWQIEQNRTSWPALNIFPLYPSWLEKLWRDYTSRHIRNHPLLLSAQQEQIIWEKILREANENLLHISATAKLAKSAWEILKKWSVKTSDPNLKLTEDSRAFLTWANEFEQLCQTHAWLDQNSIASHLQYIIQKKLIDIPAQLILMGFTDIPPQYQYLLKICEQNGCQIRYYHSPSRNETTRVIALNDTETEIRTMATWANSLLPQSSAIACIIPNLETLRENIHHIFSEHIEAQQFNISAGKNLSTYPIIHDALQLLQVKMSVLSPQDITTLLRSPFIGEAEKEYFNRAEFEIRLRNANMHFMSLKDLLVNPTHFNLAQHCKDLARRLKKFCELRELYAREILTAQEWAKKFNELLSHLGWPGERSLNSSEYQLVQNAWLPLLHEFSSYSHILGPVTYAEAGYFLNCLANTIVFQPESPASPIQILGLLEAADIPFEHAWVMGLDDTSWPPRPKPNPFIPLRLQKQLQMPNASPERELLYCQQLTQQLQSSSSHVIFSFPKHDNEAELQPSFLLKDFATCTSLPLQQLMRPAESIYQTQQLQWIHDEIGPMIQPNETIYGGVTIFKTQATCPFKAFAELRLNARKIEDTTLGLRKLDQGNIIHKAMELLWRELKDSASLHSKSENELKQLIQNCVAEAIKEIARGSATHQPRYLMLETERIQNLIAQWLQMEKTRPPFQVIALEQEITATIGKITTRLRIDRIDELISESDTAKQLIIDYKTGKEINKNNWFSARLEEPQLPLYCTVNPQETFGIAFAQINAYQMKWVGISKIPAQMTTLELLENIKSSDAPEWDKQMQIWQNHLLQLAEDFYDGKASVTPKNPMHCRICSLKSLCRIHESHHTENEEDYDAIN